MRKVLPGVAISVFLTALVIAQYMHQRGDLQFALPSAGEARELDWVALILQGTFLLLGIAFAHAFKRLSELRQKQVSTVEFGAEVKLMMKSVSLWLAMAASPMVFGVVYVLTGDMPLGTALFIAFQNGFFWERVMPQSPIELQPASA